MYIYFCGAELAFYNKSFSLYTCSRFETPVTIPTPVSYMFLHSIKICYYLNISDAFSDPDANLLTGGVFFFLIPVPSAISDIRDNSQESLLAPKN